MVIIDDIVVPVLLSMGANYLYEKFKGSVLDAAYERALHRWSRNNSIREDMARHRLSHLKELAGYIISPETVKNQEIAKLLMFWEEELREDKDAYQYMHEVLERETLAGVRENQSLLIRSGRIMQQLQKGQIELLKEIKALKVNAIVEQIEDIPFEGVERYVPRTVYAPSMAVEEARNGCLSPQGSLRLPLIHFLTEEVEELRNTNKFILYSSAQSGKTTELKHVAWELQTSGFYQVYFYEIKDYSSRISLVSFLQYTRTEGKVTVLLVDGLDEINDGDRLNLLKDLEAFAKKHPSLRMLLSCRRNFQQNFTLESFYPLYLNELVWEEVCEYIKCYVVKPLALIHQIEKLDLYQFTTIPFYLNTLIAYYGEKRHLPRGKREVYQYWIEKSFEVERNKLIDGVDDDYPEGELLLSKVAVLMQLTEKPSFTEKEMLEIFRHDRRKIFLCRRFTIFKRDIHRNYSFEHNAFKEYLAASFLTGLKLEEIRRLVCYTGESKVKPLWYNTVVLFLSLLSKKNPIFGKVIDWLSRNDREMLLYVDPEYISEEVRNRIFREIILYYRELGIFYSEGHQEFRILMNFGYSVESVRFLIAEITNQICLDTYLNNLLSLLEYMNYEDLEIRNPELLKELENALFDAVAKFREEKCSYYLYVPLQHKWFCKREFIQRLYLIIKDSDNYTAIGMFTELLLSMDQTDEYIPYVLEKQKYVHNYNDGGVTYIVPRSGIYRVLSGVQTYESLCLVLKFIPQDRWGEDDEKLALKKNVLSRSVEFYPRHRDICGLVIQAYLEECGKPSEYGEQYIRESFLVYRDFFRQIAFPENCLKFYVGSLKEMLLCEDAVYEEKEKLAHIIALFLDEQQIDAICAGLDPESEIGYSFSTWLRITLEEALEKYVDDKIRQYFPKFERDLPDYKIREQKDFDILCDYELFREEVFKVIREKAPESWKDLRPASSVLNTERVNLYLIRFFSFCTKEKKYDLQRIEENIEAKEKYEAFLIREVAGKLTQNHFPVIFSPAQEELLVRLAITNIDDLIRSRKLNQQQRAALVYVLLKDVSLPEEKLLNLLPYAAFKVSVGGSGFNKDCHLFDYIRLHTDENRFQQAVLHLFDSPEALEEKLIFRMADYITENNIYEGYHLLLKEIVRCGEINRQANLIICLLKVEEGCESIKKVYSLLTVATQVFFLQKITKQEEETDWIKSVLLPVYKTLDEKFRFKALRILLYLGDLEALEYCTNWLKEDPYLFGNTDVPAFRYKNIAALDYLTEILVLTLKEKSAHDHLDAGILYSMGQIAIQSQTNLNRVIAKLTGLIKLNVEYQYLNHYIREFTEKYYERNNKRMSLEEALVKYEMKVER